MGHGSSRAGTITMGSGSRRSSRASCPSHGWISSGFQVAALQLMTGAVGPLLDIAFVDTQLDRSQVVATKAVTQVASHSLKLVYFGAAVQSSELSWQLLAAVGIATLAGTRLGTAVLERLSDATFKRYSRMIVLGIGAMYLYKAASLWLGSAAALGG